jgi:hypothetical protein
MTRRDPHDLRDRRDIERAVRVIADEHGLTGAQGSCTLSRRAEDAGISVHAAALAALSTTPRDEL